MKTAKLKILVLGADGFIGSNLIRSLIKDNKYQIRAFDLFKDGQSRNLEDVRDDIEIFPGNFLNREDIKNALKDIDYIFHFISLTTPGSSMDDPLIDIETNVKSSIVLLEECAKAKIKRIIFASSGGAIYGNQNNDCFSENDSANPISPYAISKLTIEKYLEFYKKHKGLDYLIFRYSNPYGPGQNVVGSQGIIPIFLNLIKHNKPITIFGNGKNIRDYIYIDDAINITKEIFDKKTKYALYNIGSGKGITINRVVMIMSKVSRRKVWITKMPQRDIDVLKVVLYTKRISEEFGFKPITSLEEGIKKTWEWIFKS